MRFGYVFLGLVTLASVHISSGEHSLWWLFSEYHLRSLEGAGGNRGLSHGSFNAMAKIYPLGVLGGDLANRDTMVRSLGTIGR